MSKVVVIGGGWLGQPLAEFLIGFGHSVDITKTTDEGVFELRNKRLNGFKFDLNMSQEHLLTILDNKKPEVIIGCFPPSRKYGNANNFTDLWSKLVKISQSIGVKRIIMVSSTGVYPIREGVVSESDASLTSIVNNSDRFSDRAKMLLMTEQKVIESGVSFAIVRFGGLVGPNRHPGKFITSSKKISNLAPVNMLHLKDAVRSIEFVNRIRRNVIVNVVSPANISQADFYKRAIYELGNLNEIVTITDQAGKKVSSKKIVDLGFDFHYESPMDYFKNLN